VITTTDTDPALVAHAAEFVEIELRAAERDGTRGLGISVYFRDPDGSLLESIPYRS
jgi:hypothetical protein